MFLVDGLVGRGGRGLEESEMDLNWEWSEGDLDCWSSVEVLEEEDESSDEGRKELLLVFEGMGGLEGLLTVEF